MNWERVSNTVPTRFVAVVGIFTIVLTAAFVGILAFINGNVSGASTRFPYYVLATAVAFVISLWKLEAENENVDGITVLIASTGIAIGSGILFALAVEGFRFGVYNTGEILPSRLIIYFLAAGLVCTSLGIWGLKHWREFTTYEDPTRNESVLDTVAEDYENNPVNISERTDQHDDRKPETKE